MNAPAAGGSRGNAGYAALKSGKPALDAVTAAITVLEDDPNFNAGKGAVFTHDGHNELDSAIMDGSTLKAGAIAGVRTVRNPILLARSVMEKSPHVMMAGRGAEDFAKANGITLVEPAYFRTERRWQQLQKALAEEGVPAVPQVTKSNGGVMSGSTYCTCCTAARWATSATPSPLCALKAELSWSNVLKK